MRFRASRHRLTPVALCAGLVGSALLGVGATGTFSALTATITNDTNTAGTGSIVMRETDATGTAGTACTSTSSSSSTNSSTCSTFNKYGGKLDLLPGGTSTKTVLISNTGTFEAAGFTLAPGPCTPTNPLSTSGSICSSLLLTLDCTVYTGNAAGTTRHIYSGVTLTSIASSTKDLKTPNSCIPAIGAGNYTKMDFLVQLDPAAGNEVQGQSASQPLVWQFSAGA